MSTLIIPHPEPTNELNDQSLSKSEKFYLRQVFRLDSVDFVEVPVGKPLERFTQYGILPNSKYDFSVYLEIARLMAQDLSPEKIANHLQVEFESLAHARISRVFVKHAVEILTSALLTTIPQMINEPFVMMVDSTIRFASGEVLLVVLGLPISQINSINQEQASFFPITAGFLPSENKIDLTKIFSKLKDQLLMQPVSVISDFAFGFQSTLPDQFPDSIQQGCAYHALEILVRILITPSRTKLLKALNPIIKSLRLQCRKLKYRTEITEIQIMVTTIEKILSKPKGNFGANLLKVVEKLLAIQSWISEKLKIIKQIDEFKDLLKIFESKTWNKLKALMIQFRDRFDLFENFRTFLRTQFWQTHLKNPENAAKHSFKELKSNILKNFKSIPELETAITRFEELFPYLLPAMINPKLPRTTSILEGVHGQVKKHLRKWNGHQKISSSFDWVAPLLSLIHGYSDLEIYFDQIDLIPSTTWLLTSQVVSQKRQSQASITRISNSFAKLSSDGLIRQLNNLLGVILN